MKKQKNKLLRVRLWENLILNVNAKLFFEDKL